MIARSAPVRGSVRGKARGAVATASPPAPAPPALVALPWTLSIDWAGAPGADRVEVTQAELDLSPPDPAALDAVPFRPTVTTVADSVWQLDVPAGLRLRTLALEDLADPKGNAVSDAPVGDDGRRLAVWLADPGGGFSSVRFAAPPVDAHGMYPGTLAGASFSGGILTLPDVLTSSVQLALVKPDPNDFSAGGGYTLSKIQAVGVRYPSALKLTAADGTVAWSDPRELTAGAPPLHVDVKAALQAALSARFTQGTLSLGYTLSGTGASKLVVSGLAFHGALVRTLAKKSPPAKGQPALPPGVVRSTVTGDALALSLPLPPGAPALTLDRTAVVIADLTVRYDGLRALRFGEAPSRNAGRGRIVGPAPVSRVLPPAALRGLTVARIGLHGRAPEACELSVRFTAPLSGDPLPGDPAVLRIEAGATLQTLWLTLPRPVAPGVPAAVSARATKGRFFWASDDHDLPLVRLAVLDPTPSAPSLRLGGVALPTDSTPRQNLDLTRHFPSSSPRFESEWFYTVDLGDLSIRYLR